MLILFLR